MVLCVLKSKQTTYVNKTVKCLHHRTLLVIQWCQTLNGNTPDLSAVLLVGYPPHLFLCAFLAVPLVNL